MVPKPAFPAAALRFLSAGILAAVMILSGCGEKIDPGTVGENPPTVKTATRTAALETRPRFFEAVGSVAAGTASTVAGKLMGTVTEVRVQAGDRVDKGAVLVVIDPREVKARLTQAEAALAEAEKALQAAAEGRRAARSGAELARATYQRYLGLAGTGSTTRQEFDEVKNRLEQAEAGLGQAEATEASVRQKVAQAKAALSAVRVHRQDAVVTSPYDGIVAAKMVEVGDLAAPGTPLIALESDGRYKVEWVQPEQYIGKVEIGQEVRVRVSAMGDIELTGSVNTIMPAADRRSRSFRIEAQLPGNPKLRSGMFARVLVPVAEEQVLLVPIGSVVHQGQLTGIYRVEEDRITRFRLVRLGRFFGQEVEVLSGLNPGDRYVLKPPPDLKNGDRVEAAS